MNSHWTCAHHSSRSWNDQYFCHRRWSYQPNRAIHYLPGGIHRLDSGEYKSDFVHPVPQSQAITATVFDSSNTQITPNLSWSTSDAAAFTAAGTTTGSASVVKAGSATFIATCQPPICNIGFPSPKVIFPENVITGTATSTTSTPTAATIWIASTQCGLIDSTTQLLVNSDDCVSTVAPIDTTTNTLGVGVDLPALPDSIQFSRQGTSLYLGADNGRLGAVGLSIQ